MRSRLGLVPILMLLPLTSSVGAQPARNLPEQVTLDQVLQLFDHDSPWTAAQRASIDVVATDRIAAATLPNPTVTYGGTHLVSGLSTGATSQHQFTVDQPLLLFGQRDARRRLADQNVESEQARVAVSIGERRLEIRQAFASLQARQDEVRVFEGAKVELRRIGDVVRGRAEAGERSRYDVLRIQTEERLLAVEAMNAVTEAQDASGRLAALLGFDGWRPIAAGPLQVGATPTDFDALWAVAQQRRPTILEVQRRVTAAEIGINAARRERLPVPVVTAGGVRTQDVGGTSAVFGASVPIPLFDRNRAAIARASAELEAQRRELASELASSRAAIERTRTTLAGRRSALESLDRDIVDTLPDLRRMAEASYREGQGDILELLDASRSWKEIQLQRVKQLEMTKLAEEDVIAAAGLDGPSIQ